MRRMEDSEHESSQSAKLGLALVNKKYVDAAINTNHVTHDMRKKHPAV